VIAVIALWVKRYLIIIPTLETPLLPLQDIRQEYIHYQPTLVEWLLTFAGVAMFCFLFYLFSKFIPILPVVNVKEGRNYADLRKMVENRIINRKVKELKRLESQKLKKSKS
jgi:molybdopterin-containing oxidoreductase family membrane subunit